MKSISPIERIRLWIALSESPFLWIASVGTTVVVCGIWALLLYARTPSGPAIDQPATIVGMGNLLTDTGNEPQAVVRMPDGVVATAGLTRTHQCRPGDIVTVQVEPQRWGTSRTIRRRGCNT